MRPTLAPATPHRLIAREKERVRTEARSLTGILLNENSLLVAPNLEEVTGSLHCAQGSRLDAPKLRKSSDLTVKGAEVAVPALEKVLGWLKVLGADTVLRAPKLTNVIDKLKVDEDCTFVGEELLELGSLEVEANGKVCADKLQTVGEVIALRGFGQRVILGLPGLRSVGHIDLAGQAELAVTGLTACGDIYMADASGLEADDLQTTGSIYLGAGTALTMPGLVLIDGDLGIGEGAFFCAPKIERIEGDLHCAPESSLRMQALFTSTSSLVGGSSSIAGTATYGPGARFGAKPRSPRI